MKTRNFQKGKKMAYYFFLYISLSKDNDDLALLHKFCIFHNVLLYRI